MTTGESGAPIPATVLEGSGLTLRPWSPADLPWLVDAVADPDIARWTNMANPFTAGAAVAWVELQRSLQQAGTGIGFAIARTESDELLGSIGLFGIDGESGEVGYWLAWEARGQGVAAVALDLVAGWGVAGLGLARVWAQVAVGNEASRRVAERAGFELTGTVVAGCHDGDQATDAVVLTRWAPAR